MGLGTPPTLPTVLAVGGLVYLPACLIAALHGSSWVEPFLLVPCVRVIARIPRDYAVKAVVVGTLAAVCMAAESIGRRVIAHLPIPILPRMIAAALVLYPSMLMARAIGLLARENAEVLG